MFIVAYFFVILMAAGHLYTYYPQLPELMATHFTSDGTPNGWMSRNAFVWFEMTFQAVVPGLFFLSGAIVGKWPHLVNIPNRDYWLAPERRADTIWSLRRALAVYGLLIGLFFVATCHFLVDLNLRHPPVANATLIVGMVGGFSCATLFFVIWCYRRFHKPAV